MRRIFHIAIALSLSCSALGQQDVHFSNWLNNGLDYNPAFAGSVGVMSGLAIYKHQWTGFEGAPRSQTINFHQPLIATKMAYGATFTSNFSDPIASFDLSGNLAYKLKFDDFNLQFGAKLSGKFIKSSFSQFDFGSQADPAFMGEDFSSFKPNVGFGTYLFDKDWYIGLSMPKMIRQKLSPDENTGYYEPTAYFSAGKAFVLDRSFRLRTAGFAAWDRNSPLFFDLNVAGLFGQKIWIGFHGGTNQYGAYFQYMINHQLRIGYSVDILGRRSYTVLGNSHELVIRFDFLDNSRKVFTFRL